MALEGGRGRRMRSSVGLLEGFGLKFPVFLGGWFGECVSIRGKRTECGAKVAEREKGKELSKGNLLFTFYSSLGKRGAWKIWQKKGNDFARILSVHEPPA